MLPPLQLMSLQIEALFRCDTDGRLRSINEVGLPPAPRFFMGRTIEGNLWRVRYDLPAELVQALDELCGLEPITTDLTREPVNHQAIKQLLDTHQPITSEWRGPAYLFPNPVTAPPHSVQVSEANVNLVSPWFDNVQEVLNESWPCFVVLEAGRAVSICFSSRLTLKAAEAGVQTVEAFRGRGYAAAVVSAWAATIQNSGRTPLYSTSWDNLASQGVARRLGLMCYGDDVSIS